jgi:hypothetical protein
MSRWRTWFWVCAVVAFCVWVGSGSGSESGTLDLIEVQQPLWYSWPIGLFRQVGAPIHPNRWFLLFALGAAAAAMGLSSAETRLHGFILSGGQ